MRLLRVGVLVVAAATLTACGLRDGGGTQRQAPARDTAARVVTEKDFDHRNIVVTVSDLVKVVDGVPAMVLWERDTTAASWSRPSWPSTPRTTTATSGTSASTPRSTKTASSPGRRHGSPVSRAPGPGWPCWPTRPQGHLLPGQGPAVDYTDRARVYKLGQAPASPPAATRMSWSPTSSPLTSRRPVS